MAKEKYRVTADGELVPVLNEAGAELPDPVPVAPPVGFVPELPLHLRIRQMVQDEYRRAAEDGDVETEEEADDFFIPDEDDPREGRFAFVPASEYEENYEPPASFKEMRERLVAAGWSPPERDTSSDSKPSAGGAGEVKVEQQSKSAKGEVVLEGKKA